MKMTFGERVCQLRKARHLTQQNLANLMGYTDRSMLAKIETGASDVPATKLAKLARILHTTPNYLCGWEEADSYEDDLR